MDFLYGKVHIILKPRNVKIGGDSIFPIIEQKYVENSVFIDILVEDFKKDLVNFRPKHFFPSAMFWPTIFSAKRYFFRKHDFFGEK